MLRQIKPKNARAKRALEKQAPKVIESPKTALFLRYTTCSAVVQDAMQDLFAMKQPLAKKFTKKNSIHPFDDPASLEFFSEKNDTSLMVFGSSSKKRPHSLTLVRMFNYKVLDMLELYLDAESFRKISQFKNSRKVAVGTRPLLVFAGTAFESPVSNAWTTAKSMFTDFFQGETADKIDVEGIQYVITISADEACGEVDDPASKPVLHLRSYLIQTKRSGQKLPRVEVEEMGPRMDFRIGRLQEPTEAMLKEAMRKAKTTEARTKKNISTDIMGDKLGRIHLGKQDLSQLQTRKMKGLKRSRDQGAEEGHEVDGDDAPKKKRS